MFKNKIANNTPLYLKARALDGDDVIATSLCLVPDVSRKMRGMGWKLVIEEMQDIDFHEDALAFGMAHTYDEGKRMVLDFASFLDANVDHIVGMDDCIIQAMIVDPNMDKPVRDLTIHWSRKRATSDKVVPLFGPRPWRGNRGLS